MNTSRTVTSDSDAFNSSDDLNNIEWDSTEKNVKATMSIKEKLRRFLQQKRTSMQNKVNIELPSNISSEEINTKESSNTSDYYAANGK